MESLLQKVENALRNFENGKFGVENGKLSVENGKFGVEDGKFIAQEGVRSDILLVPKALDRIEICSFSCRQNAEYEADTDGCSEAGDHGPGRNLRRDARNEQQY